MDVKSFCILNMVRFSKARDELLIELVKGHNILYNISDENFKNYILKHKRWEEISEVVGVPVPDCKKRWKSLRDQYNKKKRGDLTGAEGTNSNWEYMNILSFLSDTVEKPENVAQSAALVKDEDTGNEEHHEDRDEEKSNQSISNEKSQEDPLNAEENTFKRNKKRFMKRHLPEPATKLTAKRRKRSTLYENVVNQEPVFKTPTQKFFESMADIVDKLPSHLQADVRLKVCQIVTDAELKHHTNTLYPNIESHSYNQFSNTEDYPNMSATQIASNIDEFGGTSMTCSKFKVDVE